MTYRKKLIEVALPLDAINAAAVREKAIKKGHPSSLHLWWARRPLAACRAILFAQLVDDPSDEKERERLFNIIEKLVKWENTTNEEVLEEARAEIRRCWGDAPPPIYDPFSGGASIPLEAQRLGVPARASDLNPVAALIGKASIEFPPQFHNQPPQHPGLKKQHSYRGAEGLVEDIRYCAQQINQRAWQKIGDLYPKVALPAHEGGGQGTVMAWFWERTVPSPNPRAQGAHVPLIRTYWLCNKPKKKVWRVPHIAPDGKITFAIRQGTPDDARAIAMGTKRGRGAHFTCLRTGDAITPDYVRAQGKAGRMGWMLTAIAAEGKRGRVYLEANEEHAQKAFSQKPHWCPDNPFPPHSTKIDTLRYGLGNFSDLFMDRQTIALTTFLDLIPDVVDAIDASPAYRQALTTYLALWVSNCAERQSTNTTWYVSQESLRDVFSRQAIPMVWGTAEGNPFSSSPGNFLGQVDALAKAVATLPARGAEGKVVRQDAREVDFSDFVISTDPPYYDNINYAELADFFYVWLRRALRSHYPQLFQTTLTPKAEELVAHQKRHGGREQADQFFLDGMKRVIGHMAKQGCPEAPATLYYAFRQSEVEDDGTSSRGWATFLQAVVEAGYAVNRTWPVRTELVAGLRGKENALTTSVVLVCRPRPSDAGTTTRGAFARELKRTLPKALHAMQLANIAPVDVPQASIGPGIGIFSRYHAVLESNDDKMTIKQALQLINHQLDEFLAEQEGEFDPETRFARRWFAQNGYGAGPFGDADNMARACGISVESLGEAGIAQSSGGKVRLLRREELPKDWDPRSVANPTIWACCQHLIHAHALEGEGGENGAAGMLKKMGAQHAEGVKNLAYGLYDVCDTKRGDRQEALAYNSLITAWGSITDKAKGVSLSPARQGNLNLQRKRNG